MEEITISLCYTIIMEVSENSGQVSIDVVINPARLRTGGHAIQIEGEILGTCGSALVERYNARSLNLERMPWPVKTS